MTRINLVPPRELSDQHLFAEWREIKMIPKSLARSLKARGLEGVVKMVPPAYTLNKGHVSFFYDKGAYLAQRYVDLTWELVERGVNFNKSAQFDELNVYGRFNCQLFQNWTPSAAALALVRERIASRIAEKPAWYRYTPPAQRPAGL